MMYLLLGFCLDVLYHLRLFYCCVSFLHLGRGVYLCVGLVGVYRVGMGIFHVFYFEIV
jgi:hypothetical protein